MENRNSKINNKNPKLKRTDQGDILKVAVKAHSPNIENNDRGDTEKPQLKPNHKDSANKSHDKTRKNAPNNPVKDSKPQPVIMKLDHSLKNDSYLGVDSTIESQIKQVLKVKENKTEKKSIKSNGDQNMKGNAKILDANERKRIREKYTIKSKTTSVSNERSDLADNGCSQKICHSQSLNKDKLLDSKSVSTKTKDSHSNKKSDKSYRKPVITTIRSKNDTKIYKAVTFSELKRRQATPIQIKIPTDERRNEREHPSDKITDISNSSREKSSRKSIHKKHRHLPSPELLKKGESPPTEVAKWAPSCVNKHTIPYYEAWVDTTLAAISKCSKKDKMILEKKNLLQSFKRFLERPETPELVYDQMDERYTGKIKVRHRQ